MFYDSPDMSTLKNALEDEVITGFYKSWLRYLCDSFIFCSGNMAYVFLFLSTTQDGFELPSRLSLSAADCFLTLTESLAKRPRVSSDRQKSSNFKASVTSAPCENKEKLAHKTSELSNMEMEFLLWDHLQELISLVQRLLAVCSILVIFWTFKFLWCAISV